MIQTGTKAAIGSKDVEWMARHTQQKLKIPFREGSKSTPSEGSNDEGGCWPYLEFLGIQAGDEKNTESKYDIGKALKKIRPEVAIRTDSRSWRRYYSEITADISMLTRRKK
ncbi:hypothetical protein BGZ76_002555 [Entomortierella beljakovae]|nr:hypothetical protein BGZ76_002555 [Entomortierella beljakovae]